MNSAKMAAITVLAVVLVAGLAFLYYKTDIGQFRRQSQCPVQFSKSAGGVCRPQRIGNSFHRQRRLRSIEGHHVRQDGGMRLGVR